MLTKRNKQLIITTLFGLLIMNIGVITTSRANVETIYYLTTVTLTEMDVIEDNDIGSGEIYCESRINDFTHTTAVLEGNNGDTLVYNEILYQGWCINLSILIQVWESDGFNDDDYMGKVDKTIPVQNITLTETTYDPTDNRDEAILYIKISTSEAQTVISSETKTGDLIVWLNPLIIFGFPLIIYRRKK